MKDTQIIINEFAKLNSIEKVELLSQLYWSELTDAEKDKFLEEIEN